MKRRHFLLGSGALAGVSLGLAPAISFAAKPPVFSDDATGLAVRGADVVNYFTQKNLAMGDAAISTDWNGAKWLFSSAANRDMFVADPERYTPQYGGYCAFAMAHNAIATTVPEAWTVHKNKLYLNFSTNVRINWLTDPDGYIAKADGFWPGPLG